MKRKAHRRLIWILSLTSILPATARAQDKEPSELEKLDKVERSGTKAGLGATIETLLTSPFAPAGAAGVVYDAGAYRIQGLLFLVLQEDDVDTFGLGGRFLYVLHRARSADFGVGAGLGISHVDGPDITRIHLEGLAQIRFFVVSNVAAHAGLGLGVAFGDGGFLFGVGGQLNGSVGLSYFF